MTLAHQPDRLLSLRHTYTALVAVALASTVSAAPQVWGEQVGTGLVDVLRGVAEDGSGGTYECGAFQGDIDGPSIAQGDAFVTRRDVAGNVLWTKLVATAADDGGVGVASDGAGGVFLAGVQAGQLDVHWSTNYDAFVARFDGAGNQLWHVTPGVADYEEVTSCASDGAGGVFVAGRTFRDLNAAAFQDGDVFIARIDATGAVLWLDQFGSTSSDYPWNLALDGSGGALLCGSTGGVLAGPLTGTFDAWYARYDSAGNRTALHQFGSPGEMSNAQGIAADGAGGLFLAGSQGSSAFVSRIGAQGNVLWQVFYGSRGSVRDLAADGQGGVYALGTALNDFVGTNAGLVDPWIQRYDGSGAVLQSTMFGSKGNDMGVAIAVVGSGVIVGGSSFGPGALFGSLTGKGWIARFENCDFDSSANYCVASPNSTGQPAVIGQTGSVRVSNNDFGLFAKGCPTFETAIFLQANAQGNLLFGNGTLCVAGNVQRLGTVSTLAGTATLALDLTDLGSPAAQITPGSTWNFQLWYRDTAGGGAGFNLSNALSATFCP